MLTLLLIYKNLSSLCPPHICQKFSLFAPIFSVRKPKKMSGGYLCRGISTYFPTFFRTFWFSNLSCNRVARKNSAAVFSGRYYNLGVHQPT